MFAPNIRMSVANILDPSTGEIRPEYLSTSAVIENQVVPFDAPLTLNYTGPGVLAFPGTTITGLQPGDIYQISGAYTWTSSIPSPGSFPAIVVRLSGNVLPSLILTGQLAMCRPTNVGPNAGTFNIMVRNPTDSTTQTQLQLAIDDNNLGTPAMTFNLFSVFINKINP